MGEHARAVQQRLEIVSLSQTRQADLSAGSDAVNLRGVLCPRIAQRDDPVEHGFTLLRVHRVGEEIGQPLELESIARLGRRK